MNDALFLITRKISDLRSLGSTGPSQVVCLCTTAGVLEECDKLGFRGILLTEEPLRELYDAVNRWAYREAKELTGHFKPRREAFLFFEAYHVFLRALFIRTLSLDLLLKRLIAEQGILRIGIVESKPSFLGLAFKVCLEEHYPSVSYTIFPSAVSSADATPPADTKEFFKRYLARLCGPARLAGEPANKRGRKRLLVSGALNHLAPAIESLRETGPVDILFVENTFDLNKFFYCLKRGFKYVVLDAPRGQPEYADGLTEYFRKRPVKFNGTDLTRICARTFKEALSDRGFYPYFYSFYDREAAAELFERLPIDAVLLDEDFSPRRLFVALAAAKHRPSFVVSHGIPYVHVEGDASLTVSSAVTFVNSEFEKEVYRKIFYGQENLVVTGLPRYDGLSRAGRPASSGGRSVLFCSSSMEGWDFEPFYYGIGERDVLGDMMKVYLRDLLDATDRPAERLVLKIKPHYNHERYFKVLFKEWGVQRRDVELLSHQENFFDLLLKADLVVTTESTVICEALMLGKPVIVLDYPDCLTRSHYEARGVVLRITSREELREAIQKVFQDANCAQELEKNRAKSGDYFTGPVDGKNSSRVAGVIREHLQKQ